MIRTSAAAFLGLLLCSFTFCQTNTSSPAFEVATVRANTSGTFQEFSSADGGRLTFRNIPMVVILAFAHRVTNDRVSGPSWIWTERFDIVAKFPPDTTDDEMRLMLQNILAERFHMTVHHEERPVPVYALVVGDKGPKLKESAADSVEKEGCSRNGAQITCQSQKTTMANLARNFPRWGPLDWFDLPVVDQTGFNGFYDFTLTFTQTKRPDGSGENVDAADLDTVPLFDALQDQLGLKLVRRKVALDRIVIDHLDRVPTEN